MSDLDYGKEEGEKDGFRSYVQPSNEGGSDMATPPNDKIQAGDDAFEIFKHVEGGVEYRTVSWQRAAVIFTKVIFATGVLSIPSTMISLGAVGGGILVVCFGVINTYTALVLGRFRNAHAGCHTVADMARYVGGPILYEVVGILYLVAYVLCAGAGILGVSIGLNALSDHAACTVIWSFIATVVIIACASLPKFHQIGWLTWAGFISIFAAVFIVVIAVTVQDRPYAAPAGVTDYGYHAIPPVTATFAAGLLACTNIFVSSAGTSAFIPVISEMKRPQDFTKALLICMIFVTASYLAFSLVVYRWCGIYVASPSLSSAGPVIEKVAYGVGLIGLIVSGVLYLHVGAKYLFVRILRNSPHLQAKTPTHWIAWLGSTISLGAISFVLAEAIPIFNYLIGLTGSLCFAPMALMLPPVFFFYDVKHRVYPLNTFLRKFEAGCNAVLLAVGAFFFVAGTYGVALSIKEAYASGLIGGAFSCANNAA